MTCFLTGCYPFFLGSIQRVANESAPRPLCRSTRLGLHPELRMFLPSARLSVETRFDGRTLPFSFLRVLSLCQIVSRTRFF